jgi:signal transduction histidine kinase
MDLPRDDRSVSVLIVDAHPSSRLSLEATLEPLGGRVLSASSAEDALELLRVFDVACVLLDVHLPGLDGWETARRIKSQERTRHLPLLFVTASREEAHIRRGYAVGAVDYLLTPYDPDILRAKVKVFMDLHLQARLELRQRREEADRAVRLRDEFLSIAAHELRAPMTALGLRLHELERVAQEAPEDSPFVSRLHTRVDVARRQLKRVSELVGGLMDVSSISTGRLRLEREEVDLAALVREVSGRFEPQACRGGSPLELDCEAPVIGRWDRRWLEQVISQLLGHALEYGANKPVHLRVEASGDAARLRVRDEGRGFDSQEQARLFEKFGPPVGGRSFQGALLGCGLFITRGIVEALGGRIHVKSALGEGAEFTVELPRMLLSASEDVPASARSS